MVVSKTIRGDEWLAELERLSRKNDRGQTATEIGSAVGKTAGAVRMLLRRVMAMGRLEVGKRTIQRIDGRTTTITVYSILKPATAKCRGRKK